MMPILNTWRAVGYTLAVISKYRTNSDEADSFLLQHPDTQVVDLLLCDTHGIFRGKRLQASSLPKAYNSGILLSKSLFAQDITGKTAEAAGIGFETGDMDCVCLPLPGTLCPAPWHGRPSAQSLLRMFDAQGKPYPGDPQSVLDSVLERFMETNLTPVVAIELEFFLIDRNRKKNNKPQHPISPVTGERERHTNVYAIADLDDYSKLLGEINDVAAIQGIPADTAVAEYAPGQFEINLYHQADAQLACRHALMLKRVIKGIAHKHGFEATFMPKPFPDQVGSGTHIHISLLDESGNNVFALGEQPANQTLRSAIAGLAETMAESMLLFAPNANSYRRFVAEWYVPLNPSWGINNRTVALRIPGGDPDARRIEHRLAGADTNPYLLTAAVLAGIHYGITKKLEPAPMTQGNAYEQHVPSLPITWDSTLQAFEQSKIVSGYLGEEFCRVYSAVKRQEYEEFNLEITPLEYDWYLRSC